MKSVLLGVLALVLFQSAPVLAETKDAEAHYQTLLAAAKSGGPVDWQALRFAAVDRPDYDEHVTDDDRKTAMAALSANDDAKLLTAANSAIDKDFTDALAHVLARIAYTHLKRPADAARENAVGNGLLTSIETGNGLTPETAFTAVTVREEYDLMLMRGWTLKSQALSHQGEHGYDVMTVTDQAGKEIVYYFQIDRVLAAEAALFNLK